MSKIKVIILAAGQGKRFGSPRPKVLAQLGDKPMILRVVTAVEQSGVTDRPVVVVGVGAEHVREVLGDRADYVLQTEQLGTGHAVACCRTFLEDKADAIQVLYGDHPLISGATIRQLVTEHERTVATLTMGTVVVPDFEEWRQGFSNFGRIVRDASGKLQRIVEVKDATPEERNIREVNPSYFCFNAPWLWENIGRLGKNNAQDEYYLTDLLGLAIDQGRMVTTVPIAPAEALGANSPEQLEAICKVAGH